MIIYLLFQYICNCQITKNKRSNFNILNICILNIYILKKSKINFKDSVNKESFTLKFIISIVKKYAYIYMKKIINAQLFK